MVVVAATPPQLHRGLGHVPHQQTTRRSRGAWAPRRKVTPGPRQFLFPQTLYFCHIHTVAATAHLFLQSSSVVKPGVISGLILIFTDKIWKLLRDFSTMTSHGISITLPQPMNTKFFTLMHVNLSCKYLYTSSITKLCLYYLIFFLSEALLMMSESMFIVTVAFTRQRLHVAGGASGSSGYGDAFISIYINTFLLLLFLSRFSNTCTLLFFSLSFLTFTPYTWTQISVLSTLYTGKTYQLLLGLKVFKRQICNGCCCLKWNLLHYADV